MIRGTEKENSAISSGLIAQGISECRASAFEVNGEQESISPIQEQNESRKLRRLPPLRYKE